MILGKDIQSEEVTFLMTMRICRKMAKIFFGLFETKEKLDDNITKTMFAYQDLVSMRAPQYFFYETKLPFVPDLAYLQKRMKRMTKVVNSAYPKPIHFYDEFLGVNFPPLRTLDSD